MKRKRITVAQRVKIFDSQGGICHICDQPIRNAAWHLDHIKPLSIGGEDTPWNLAPAHDRCHRDKTAGEAPIRAKAVRVRARHIGANKRGGRGFRGWRKFDGTVVHADRDD